MKREICCSDMCNFCGITGAITNDGGYSTYCYNCACPLPYETEFKIEGKIIYSEFLKEAREKGKSVYDKWIGDESAEGIQEIHEYFVKYENKKYSLGKEVYLEKNGDIMFL